MKEQLAKIRSEALAAFGQAQSAAELDSLRVQYLGKKGELTAVLKMMGKLSAEERPAMGQLANEVRSALEAAIEAASGKLEAQALEQRLKDEAVDVTIPGREVKLGHKHPMYLALDEIKDIFIGMGFTVLDGPEVELAEYNFDKLNAEEGHPSRDWSRLWNCLSASSPPAGCTVRMRWMRPTPPCSTRWRAWSSTRGSPWPI